MANGEREIFDRMEMDGCMKRIGHDNHRIPKGNYVRKTMGGKSFTSHPGRNLVDGLPPATSPVPVVLQIEQPEDHIAYNEWPCRPSRPY